MSQWADYIKRMPKVDLHCHLDGSVTPETLVKLADLQRMELPTRLRGDLLHYLQAPDDCANLLEYLTKFDFVLGYLQTGKALEMAAQALVQTAAQENVYYIEVRFAPQLHTTMGLTSAEAVEAVCRGLKQGEQEYGITARAILIAMRDRPVAENMPLLELAERYRPLGVVGVDIAGDEFHYPTGTQAEFLAGAAKRDIPFTVHAGESGPSENIAAALELGAARIGHGTHLRDDPVLLEQVRQRKIPLELCPTSNLQTKATPNWKSYPVREYFDKGLIVTIHTDNRTVSSTTVGREYNILADRFDFTGPMLAQVVRNGVEAAFLPPERKKGLRDSVNAELARL